MHLRRVFPSLVLLGIAGGPFIIGHSAIQSTAVQTKSNECRVTISGRDKPDRVPTQDVWEATFRRLSADPSMAAIGSGLGSQVRVRLSSVGAAALERASALRQSLPTAPTAGLPQQAAQDRELVIADAILDARDNALRELSDYDLDQLSDYAQETARTLTVTLPVAGRPVVDDEGTRLCRVDVTGRDYPHLLPEHQVWRFMFDAWAGGVDYHLREHGQIADDYLRLLGRSVFRGMPSEDIQTFLRISKDTSAAVARLTSASPAELQAATQPFESILQRTVMSGKHAVLRAISIDGWRALMVYVDQFRVGVKAWYTAPI